MTTPPRRVAREEAAASAAMPLTQGTQTRWVQGGGNVYADGHSDSASKQTGHSTSSSSGGASSRLCRRGCLPVPNQSPYDTHPFAR